MPGAYLELVRPANVATALGDVLAGFAVAGLSPASALPWLLLATACLYAGGIVLNDVFDREVDAVERPERPLPSGRVTARHAAALGGLLLAAGILAATLATRDAAAVAVATALAVLLYDGWSKKYRVLGPVNMGLCRGLNLALGMAAVPGTIGAFWPLCLIPLTYIAGVTILSRGEVSGGRQASVTLSLTLVGTAILAVLFVGARLERHVWPSVAATAVFAGTVLPAFARARRTPSPPIIRRAVKQGILSLVLLDAALATAFAGPGYGLVLLAVALGAIWLGRSFSVT